MSSNEKLRKLEQIEQQLCQSLQCASQAFTELSKDKPNMKNVESHTSQFLKALETIDADISKQIAYLSQVSTGQPHEGSSYASMKALHMAHHRLEHSRSKLCELERFKIAQNINYHQTMQTQPQQQQQQQQHTTATSQY